MCAPKPYAIRGFWTDQALELLGGRDEVFCRAHEYNCRTYPLEFDTLRDAAVCAKRLTAGRRPWAERGTVMVVQREGIRDVTPDDFPYRGYRWEWDEREVPYTLLAEAAQQEPQL